MQIVGQFAYSNREFLTNDCIRSAHFSWLLVFIMWFKKLEKKHFTAKTNRSCSLRRGAIYFFLGGGGSECSQSHLISLTCVSTSVSLRVFSADWLRRLVPISSMVAV